MKEVSPFTDDLTLSNIVNGVIADPSTNVENIFNIGQILIEKMSGQNMYKFVCKRNERAETMAM